MDRHTILLILIYLLLAHVTFVACRCIKFDPNAYPPSSKTRNGPPESFPPGSVVDWWVVWKGPNGDNSFYIDSESQVPVPLEVMQFDKFLVHHAVIVDNENLKAIEAAQVFLKNGNMYLAKDVLKEAQESYAATVLPELKTIALYFNDQFTTADGINTDKHYHSKTFSDRLGWQDFRWKFAHSKFMLGIDVTASGSQTTGGFVLQHAMPQSPGATINKQNYLEKPDFFIPSSDAKGANVKSQHAFCVNIKSGPTMEAVLKGLVKSRPKFIHANIDYLLLDPIRETKTTFADSLGKLVDKYWGTEHFDACKNAWPDLRERIPWEEMMTNIPAACFTKIDLQDNNNNNNNPSSVVMFTHPAMPHNKDMPEDEDGSDDSDGNANTQATKKRKAEDNSPAKMKEPKITDPSAEQKIFDFEVQDNKLSIIELEYLAWYADQLKPKLRSKRKNRNWKNILQSASSEQLRPGYIEIINKVKKELIKDSQRTKKVHSTYFGPIHWDLVARNLDAQPIPLMVTCWKNKNLPSIFNVDLVDSFASVPHGSRHEKIGIAAVDEASGKYWVCFGDANHRTSEISHAGMTICLKNKAVWKKMYGLVDSVYKRPDGFSKSLATLPNKEGVFKDPVGFKQPYKMQIRPDGPGDEYKGVSNNNNNMDDSQ